jgi:hypothetical protein
LQGPAAGPEVREWRIGKALEIGWEIAGIPTATRICGLSAVESRLGSMCAKMRQNAPITRHDWLPIDYLLFYS